LRERRRKDPKFNAFLQEAESDPVCRRLGIKDMIPMAMQRLTKYPLLFENLCNCTSKESEEYKNVQRAVDLSKEILCHVNSMKKEAEDHERLIEIQRKLDKSAFEKDKSDAEIRVSISPTQYFKTNESKISSVILIISLIELQNLDFTKHHLIYEGPLMWRMTKSSRQKSEQQEVQAVLLHDMIVILLKQDDRYVLKSHSMGFHGKADRMGGMVAKPLIKLNNLHHRPVATGRLLSKLVTIRISFYTPD
jgi:Rho guanine nucleotide exchange factor 12